MFETFLTDFNIVLAAIVAAYLTGVFTSQKAKDFFSGVPSAARAALKASENDLLMKLKAAEADVLAKLPGATAKVAAPAGTPLKAPVVTVEKVALAPAPVAPVAVPVAPVVAVVEPVAAPAPGLTA